MKLSEPLAALKHLRLALNDPELDAKRKVITKQDFDAAYAATGHVALTTSPGASVTVDGNAVEGTAPFADAIDVTAGKHTLEARLGGQSAKMEVDAKAGQVSSIEIAIAPAPPSPPLATSAAAPSLAPPSTTSLPETPSPEGAPTFWNGRRKVGIVVAGAGIVALGLSAYFFADGNSQRDHATSLAAGLPSGACGGSSPASGCSAFQDAQNTQNTDRMLSGVLVGVGGAAVAVGAAMFFWPSKSTSQTAIVPYVSPHGGGLQLRQEL